MDEREVESLIGRYEQELNKKTAENVQLATQASSLFAGQQDPNLIEYQLELDNILERIEHLLKGHVIKVDKEGTYYYEEPKDPNLKIFNETGVQLLMNIISSYINRNTILSNYKEERINQILNAVGLEITDQIFLLYDKIGLDTPEKKKRFPIVVMQITHMIESVYNRALGGRELDSLRTGRTVVQTETLGGFNNRPNLPIQKSKSFLKPWTWFST